MPRIFDGAAPAALPDHVDDIATRMPGRQGAGMRLSSRLDAIDRFQAQHDFLQIRLQQEQIEQLRDPRPGQPKPARHGRPIRHRPSSIARWM